MECSGEIVEEGASDEGSATTSGSGEPPPETDIWPELQHLQEMGIGTRVILELQQHLMCQTVTGEDTEQIRLLLDRENPEEALSEWLDGVAARDDRENREAAAIKIQGFWKEWREPPAQHRPDIPNGPLTELLRLHPDWENNWRCDFCDLALEEPTREFWARPQIPGGTFRRCTGEEILRNQFSVDDPYLAKCCADCGPTVRQHSGSGAAGVLPCGCQWTVDASGYQAFRNTCGHH